MEASNPTKVTVETVIQAPVAKVWSYWTAPDHITKWNQPSEDWHAPKAENDLRVGGTFDQGKATKVVEIFDAESTHPVEFQQAGWQAIMDSFKRYAEKAGQ